MPTHQPDTCPEYVIRQATIDDLAGIFHLGEQLFTPRDYSNLYRTWDQYEVTNQFNLESDYMQVAETCGRIIGFAIGSVFEKPRTAWNYGHLVWLGVDPDFARCGVGSRLFDVFRETMERAGVRMLVVDTQADTQSALAFFRKKGFLNPTAHVYLTLNLHAGEHVP